MCRPFSFSLSQPRQREDDGYTDNEHEQRKEQIVKTKALPWCMLELVADKLDSRAQHALLAGGQVMQRPGESVSRDDPEHRETPKGVDRCDATRHYVRCGRDGPRTTSVRYRSTLREWCINGARKSRRGHTGIEVPGDCIVRRVRHCRLDRPSRLST